MHISVYVLTQICLPIKYRSIYCLDYVLQLVYSNDKCGETAKKIDKVREMTLLLRKKKYRITSIQMVVFDFPFGLITTYCDCMIVLGFPPQYQHLTNTIHILYTVFTHK